MQHCVSRDRTGLVSIRFSHLARYSAWRNWNMPQPRRPASYIPSLLLSILIVARHLQCRLTLLNCRLLFSAMLVLIEFGCSSSRLCTTLSSLVASISRCLLLTAAIIMTCVGDVVAFCSRPYRTVGVTSEIQSPNSTKNTRHHGSRLTAFICIGVLPGVSEIHIVQVCPLLSFATLALMAVLRVASRW